MILVTDFIYPLLEYNSFYEWKAKPRRKAGLIAGDSIP
jgi:hypothetical protein